jgi:hypothetical protein
VRVKACRSNAAVCDQAGHDQAPDALRFQFLPQIGFLQGAGVTLVNDVIGIHGM